MKEMDELILNLNLFIMFLNSWEEDSRKEPGGKVRIVLKDYPWNVLIELEKKGLIRQLVKSVIITEEGIAKAQDLSHIYNNFLESFKS